MTPLVTPFVGERFADIEAWGDLISPPYDVISDARRTELASRNDRNIVRLILPDGNGDRYENAHATLTAWREDGTLVSESEPGVFVLQQAFTTPDGGEYVRTGLIAALAAEPYDDGRVRPHEKTHKGPKEDRLALMRSTGTMFEALLMLAPDHGEGLRDALHAVTATPPLGTATLDGVGLKVWLVVGEEARRLAERAGRQDIYIADGHHRYETAVAFRQEVPAASHTLALIIPQTDPGLVVLPTHRILSGNPTTGKALRSIIDESWDVVALDQSVHATEHARLMEAGCVVLTTDGPYQCRERSDVTGARVGINLDDRIQRLNIARVDALVVGSLQRALDASVSYSADLVEVARAVSDRSATGILLPATPVEDVIGVADAHGFMPQKSTYFQPKAPSGLVMMRVR